MGWGYTMGNLRFMVFGMAFVEQQEECFWAKEVHHDVVHTLSQARVSSSR